MNLTRRTANTVHRHVTTAIMMPAVSCKVSSHLLSFGIGDVVL